MITHVLVLLDLVPGAEVTLAVPGHLGALREAEEVVASTNDGTADNARGSVTVSLSTRRKVQGRGARHVEETHAKMG